MSKCVRVGISRSKGQLFDEMIVLDRGADPRPLIDQVINKVTEQREDWLDGHDYIDRGVMVAGPKVDEITWKEGIAVEIIHDYRDNTMYVRAATRVENRKKNW